MNFKTKQLLLVFLVAIVALVALTGIGFYRMHLLSNASLVSQKQSLLVDYDALIKSQVETAVSILATVEERSVKGEFSADEAKRLGADLVRQLRYQKDGYFWIDTVDGTNIVLLGKPSEGKNRIDLQDKNGKYFIREIIKQGTKSGGGYTDYWFPKAGSEIPLPKRGYSLEFKPWGWVVGTGNYIDDIDKMISERHKASHKEFIANVGFFAGSTVIIILLFIGAGFLTYVMMRTKNEEIENADKKVADLNNRFSLAVDSAKIGVWDWYIPENKLAWDKQMFALYGAEGKDSSKAYTVWKRGVHPEDRERGNAAIEQALRGEKDFEGEFRVVWPSGEIRHLKVSALVLRDADGTPLRMIGVNYDISELKQAEEAMQRQETFLRATIDGLSVHMCVVDGEGKIVITNHAWNSFAEENGAAEGTIGEGVSYLGACCAQSEDDRADIEKFATAIKNVLNGSLTDFIKEYPCHSPVAQRWFICRINAFTVSGSTYAVISHENITKRKLAEIEQQRLYEEQHIILDNAGVGIAFVKERRIKWANVTFCDMFGYDIDDVLDAETLLLYPTADDFERFGVEVYPELRRGDTIVKNQVMRRRDGSLFTARMSGTLIDGIDHNAGSIWIFTDVTLQHELETQLQQSHSLLTALSRQIPGMIYQYCLYPDGHSCFPYASDAIQDIYGVSPEAVRYDATPVFANVHPDDYDGVEASIRESARTLQPWEHEFRVVLPHQGVRWCYSNARPENRIDGSVLWHGFVHDITERQRTEETRRKLARAVEQCPVTIVITDTDGTIEFVNPHFTELTGYSAEEAIGQNPRLLKSDQTPPEVFTELWSTITEGKTWEGDFVNKSKNGTLFQEHAVISALLDDTGAITHYLAVKEDITEKKKIMEELISSRDKAETATLAKSQFLATMSHEIRTPMNGVIGMTNLLLETQLTDEQRGYAEIVNRSGENLLSLINDILDFSKIEAGRLDMEVLNFDLRTTMEDTAELLTLRAQDAGLELICHIDPAVPIQLKGDPGRLRQIIINLAGNAIKFTHEGEVAIEVELESDLGEAVSIRFSIRDTGIGIPPSRLAAIFEPFTQADGSTTRKYGGTGLGLAICKQLTELMGGEIGIKSEEGKGSTFWFTAKFEKQTRAETQLLVPPAHIDIKNTRILVVDDNATNRKLLAALLSHWECSYELAVDAVSALRHLREAAAENNPFQVALLDHEMPGMDGSELGRQIKSDPLLQSTVLIMVTSLAQRGDAVAMEKVGFSGYLPKPIRQSQLHSCIALALDRAHAAEAPTTLITRHTVAEVATHKNASPQVATQQGVRILLAEDNIINQKVAQSILGKLGYKADVVANGLEAVQALEMIDYDIVLMDCQMPDMDGFAATAVIRDPGSQVRNHTVPIIAMTANAMQGDREHCLEAGMNDYLAKPVKKNELAVMLEKWINGSSLIAS